MAPRRRTKERERYRPIINVEGTGANLRGVVAGAKARVRELQAHVGQLAAT